MRCYYCKRDISKGPETTKMVCQYTQGDSTVKTFGLNMPDGPLSAAAGQLFRAWHSKCYFQAKKREGRGGDAMSGRMQAGVPTAYSVGEMVLNADDLQARGMTVQDVRESTRSIQSEMDRMRVLAREMGIGVQDWRVKEAFRAQEKGGPYPHHHAAQMDDFQRRPHLLHAHGKDTEGMTFPEMREWHDQEHAREAQERIRADRARDPGYRGESESDWRSQTVADIDDLPAPVEVTRVDQ